MILNDEEIQKLVDIISNHPKLAIVKSIRQAQEKTANRCLEIVKQHSLAKAAVERISNKIINEFHL